jgi:hypothetical protein
MVKTLKTPSNSLTIKHRKDKNLTIKFIIKRLLKSNNNQTKLFE